MVLLQAIQHKICTTICDCYSYTIRVLVHIGIINVICSCMIIKNRLSTSILLFIVTPKKISISYCTHTRALTDINDTGKSRATGISNLPDW